MAQYPSYCEETESRFASSATQERKDEANARSRQAGSHQAIKGNVLFGSFHGKSAMEFGRYAHLELPRIHPVRKRHRRRFAGRFHVGDGFACHGANSSQSILGPCSKP